MNSMIEAHFLGLTCQSNIYGLAPLQCGGGLHKILVATCENNVYCIEYSKNQQGAIFSNREVQFTYIPGSAEITSLDAFNEASQGHTFAVGVAFTKKENDGKHSRYFNIYSDWEFGNECDLDNIAQGCLSIRLDFIPFHLTHSKLSFNGREEIVWLLSGNDVQVHLYREDTTGQTYNEEPCETYFPEFENIKSAVLWMDIKNFSDSRLTAVGCKNGTVAVSLVKFSPEIHVESFWNIRHDAPITSVKLFEDSDVASSSDKPLLCGDSEKRKIHLLVANSVEISVVYRDVLKNGLDLKTQKYLPKSDRYDVVTCGIIADVDMDGYNEVLLGTFGQELLVYKWQANSQENKGFYVMFYQQTFANQLLQMIYIDIMGDGINELLILSNGGLHVLQHDLNKSVELISSRMKWLLENVPAEQLEKYIKISKEE